ncbi:MAG TPA: hypothetical protein VGX28_14370 [Frankiaceae bacterium]|jgi:hypothetical protein|nr:hypothetical protein [Frankiaceae bacterium]
MHRTSLAALALLALLPAPAGAVCGIGDPRGDATLADDHVLDGAYDRPVPGASVDLVTAWVDVGPRFTTFRVEVADLAASAAEAPGGVSYSWEAATRDRVVYVLAWSSPTGAAVEVYAGETLRDATWVATASGPSLDVARDTVTFSLTTQTLGLRPGAPDVRSTVRSYREVFSVDGPDRTYAQSVAADSATRRPSAWGRC